MGSVDKSSASEVVTIDVREAKDLLDSAYVYLDVRTEGEFKRGHVAAEKIFNIPYMFTTANGRLKNSQFLEEVSSLFKENDNLIVGCQSGIRSLAACTDLLAAGFQNVRNMGGGYLAWVEHGFPVKVEEKEEEKPNDAL